MPWAAFSAVLERPSSSTVFIGVLRRLHRPAPAWTDNRGWTLERNP